MYHDISCVGQPYTFPRAKSIKENVEKKINIDVINWEKLFHDPLTTNNAIYPESLIISSSVSTCLNLSKFWHQNKQPLLQYFTLDKIFHFLQVIKQKHVGMVCVMNL